MLHLHLIPAREKRRHIVNDGSTRTVALPRDAFFLSEANCALFCRLCGKLKARPIQLQARESWESEGWRGEKKY